MPLRLAKGGKTMKIVVIGGTGLIGSKAVPMLRQGGHEVVAGSPTSGINTITGEGPPTAPARTQGVGGPPQFPPWEEPAGPGVVPTFRRPPPAPDGAPR